MEYYTLRDGLQLPKIGFGTYQLAGAQGARAVSSAIQQGYRLIDTAYNYENEGAVGQGIKAANINRADLLVTSKLPGRYYQNGIAALQESLYRSQLDYLDLYLLHWPNPKQDHYVEAWQTLIDAQKFGLVRSIGVCNFLPEHLDRLYQETGVLPVINQIELHPYFNQANQRSYDQQKGILTENWSPLGRASTMLQDSTLQMLAEKYHKGVGQLILRWEIQLGTLPIPKAATVQNQIANLAVFNFNISDEDMQIISSLTQANGRTFDQDPAIYEEF